MLLQSLLNILSNHIVAKESAHADAGSYHDLMRARFGKQVAAFLEGARVLQGGQWSAGSAGSAACPSAARWGGRAVAACQVLNSLGKVVIWLIILADLIVGGPPHYEGLLPELLGLGEGEAEHKWWLRRAPWIAGLVLLAAPVVCIRSLDRLSGVSLLGDAAALLLAGLGVALGIAAAHAGDVAPLHWLPSAALLGERGGAAMALEVVSTLPVLLGAGHTQMPQLRPYSQASMDVASAATRVATMSIFATIGERHHGLPLIPSLDAAAARARLCGGAGIGNFVAFGKRVQADVLRNYSRRDLGLIVSRRAALALGTAARHAVRLCLAGRRGGRAWILVDRNLWDALPQQSAQERMSDPRSFGPTNVASLAGCAALAMVLPDVLKPLKLIGGAAVGSMAYVFPGLMCVGAARAARRAGDRGARQAAALAAGGLLVTVGAVQAAAGVAAQFA
eukprot:scaffold5.g618.t1